MRKIFLVLGSIFFLLSACVAKQQPEPVDQTSDVSSAITESIPENNHILSDLTNEPVSFSTNNLNAKIQKWTHPAMNDIEDLITMRSLNSACDQPFGDEQIAALQKAFENEQSILYKIIDPNATEPEDIDLFYVSILPNTMGYKNVLDVREDFVECGNIVIARSMLPVVEVNNDWILFAGTACGNRGSGKLERCKDAESAIPPTLYLR